MAAAAIGDRDVAFQLVHAILEFADGIEQQIDLGLLLGIARLVLGQGCFNAQALRVQIYRLMQVVSREGSIGGVGDDEGAKGCQHVDPHWQRGQ